MLEALSGNLAFFLQEEAEEFEEVLEEVDEEMVPTASWQSFQFRSKCTACVGNDGHCRHNLSVPASLPSHLAAEVGEACAFLQVAWLEEICLRSSSLPLCVLEGHAQEGSVVPLKI